MLAKGSISSVSSTAGYFASKNKKLVPRSESPLMKLTYATLTPRDAETMEEFAEIVAVLSGGDIREKTTHDRIVDELVPFISKVVQSHLNFAKTVVQPACDVYVKLVNKNYRPLVDPSGEFNIVSSQLFPILENEDFLYAVKSFKNKPVENKPRLIALEDNTMEAIESILLVGDPEAAEHYRFLLDNFRDEFIGYFYSLFSRCNFVFENKFKPDTIVKDINSLTAAYIFADRLSNNPQNVANDPSLDLNKVNEIIFDIRNTAASYLNIGLDYYNSLITSGTLVNYISGKEIGVLTPVYKQWLTEGNSQEVLFGLLVSGQRYYSTAMISQNKEELEKAFFNYLNFNTTAIKLTNFNNFLDALKVSYRELFQEYKSDSEKEAIVTSDYFVTSDRIFEQELAKVKVGDVEDLTTLAISLISKSRYYYSSAGDILSRVYEFTDKDDQLDPREAALLATIEYVSKYMARQIVVE